MRWALAALCCAVSEKRLIQPHPVISVSFGTFRKTQTSFTKSVLFTDFVNFILNMHRFIAISGLFYTDRLDDHDCDCRFFYLSLCKWYNWKMSLPTSPKLSVKQPCVFHLSLTRIIWNLIRDKRLIVELWWIMIPDGIKVPSHWTFLVHLCCDLVYGIEWLLDSFFVTAILSISPCLYLLCTVNGIANYTQNRQCNKPQLWQVQNSVSLIHE